MVKATVKVIIFDLDDTLIDTSQLLIPIAQTPAYFRRIQEPLPLMQGAKENLLALSQTQHLCLLTSGKKEEQQAKITSAQVSSFFKEIFFVDPTKNENKYVVFKKLSEIWTPDLVLSVGNRRSVDIREAKRAGLKTCLFKHGEHIDELPESSLDIPDFEVSNHSELRQKCLL